MPDPGASRTPTYAELFKAVLSRHDREVHTAIPAEVQSYDKDKQTADLQPLVKLPIAGEGGEVTAETLPVLTAVPVAFPGAGGMRLILPVKKGDTGYVIFSEASLDLWQAQGGLVDPKDPRRFHLSDAVFYPGLHDDKHPFTVDSGDDASFGKDGAHQVVVTPDVIELGGNSDSRPTDWVALAQPTKDMLNKIHDAVNSGFSALRSDLTSISSHTHNVETAGTAVKQSGTTLPSVSLATLQGPQDVGSIDDVKSSKVKAK